MQKILVLGASGMLGNAVFRYLSNQSNLSVIGSVRSAASPNYFLHDLRKNLISGVDVESVDGLIKLFSEVKPKVVINCVGLVKQLVAANEVLSAVLVNTVLPHRLAYLCKVNDAKLIHVSTDCVFNGQRGNYVEQDSSDAEDVYGKSKFLGEVSYPNSVTLRTSIIGHELNSHHGLVNWFLQQEHGVNGFTRAIFSGLPTVELARVINEFVLPKSELSGIYHVASDPISKYELLRLIAAQYGKTIDITPDDHLVLDRSLNATLFQQATGYQAPAWYELIRRMYAFQ